MIGALYILAGFYVSNETDILLISGEDHMQTLVVRSHSIIAWLLTNVKVNLKRLSHINLD